MLFGATVGNAADGTNEQDQAPYALTSQGGSTHCMKIKVGTRRRHGFTRMKSQHVCHVLVVLFCLSTWLPISAVAADSINWQTYDAGMALGKTKKKKVFLHFYANWCFYCRKMAKETFQDPSVIEHLNKNYIPIRVDSDKDKRTASMYNVRALPSTWFLTEQGERIGNAPGYMSSKQLLELLKRLATGNNKATRQGG